MDLMCFVIVEISNYRKKRSPHLVTLMASSMLS